MRAFTLPPTAVEHDGRWYIVADGEMGHDDHPAPPCGDPGCQWEPPAEWDALTTCQTCLAGPIAGRMVHNPHCLDCMNGRPLIDVRRACEHKRMTMRQEGKYGGGAQRCRDCGLWRHDYAGWQPGDGTVSLGTFTAKVLPVVSADEADQHEASYHGPACVVAWNNGSGVTVQAAWDGALDEDDCVDVPGLGVRPGQFVLALTPHGDD